MSNLQLVSVHDSRRVCVPESWRPVFEDILASKGFVPIQNKVFNGKGDGYLVIRHTGGLGDIITMIPAINALLDKVDKLSLCMPKEFYPLFKYYSRINFINYGSIPYTKMVEQYKFVFDCYCPAGDHETATNFRPTLPRIDSFAQFIGVEPKLPISIPFVARQIKKSKKVVHIQLRSANISKDIPFDTLSQIYNALSEEYNVYFVDQKKVAGYNSLYGLELEELMHVVYNADLVIAPDSGIFHLASLFDIPTLGLFGPTNGELTIKHYPNAGYIQAQNVDNICHSPCYYASVNNYTCKETIGFCMKSIEVKDVVTSAYSLLRN